MGNLSPGPRRIINVLFVWILFSKVKKEERNVYLLGLTSLLNDLSSEGIYSLLPLLLKDPSLVGIVGGTFNGLSHIVKPLSGYLSDRVGRSKPFVILGYFISSLSKLSIAFLDGMKIVVSVFFDRIGKGIRDAPRDVLLTQIKKRGWAFGLHRALDTTGALLGVLAATFLMEYVDIRTAIILLALVSFLAIIPLFFVAEKERKVERFGAVKAFQTAFSQLKGTVIVSALIGLGFVTPALFIDRAISILGQGGILLYALFNLVYVLSAYYIGKKSDIYGRRKVLALGLLSQTLALFLVSTSHPLSVLIAFALYGLSYGTVAPVVFARAGDIVKKDVGTGMGIVQASFGLAILVASVIAGYLVKSVGYSALGFFTLFPVLSLLLIRRF